MATRTQKVSSRERSTHVAQRQDADRQNDEGTALSREERLEMIRNEFVQEALPKAPDIPGYHTCWLSTTHSYDPVERRLRLGYELVRRDEVPGFEHMKSNSAEYGEYVMCNEMILSKVPQEIFQMIMQEFHHDRPLREEEAINERIKAAAEEHTDSKGQELLTREEGLEERVLVNKRPVPQFD